MPDINDIGNEAVLAELKNITNVLGQMNSALRGTAAGGASSTTSTPPTLSTGILGRNMAEDPTTMGGRLTGAGAVQTAGEMLSRAGERLAGGGGPSTPAKAMESAGRFLTSAGRDYMPNAARDAQVLGSAGRRIGAFSSGLIESGQQSGYDATGGDIQVGPFGMRTPFSAAGAVGIGQRISAFGASLGAGVTYKGQRDIQQQLNARGYAAPPGVVGDIFGVESRSNNDNYNRLKTGLTQVGKSLGENVARDPAVIDLLDRSTRMGASGVKQFVDVMKDMPGVMQAAQISQKQYVADITAFANYAQKQGATLGYGAKVGSQMMGATGMSGQTLLNTMEGGFVQTNLMRNTGLMPWQLGQATAKQNIQAMYQTMNQLDQQIATPAEKRTTDAMGFTRVTGGQNLKDADIAMMMNIPVSQVRYMRRNEKKILAGTDAIDRMDAQQQQIEAIAGGRGSEAEKQRRIVNLMSDTGGKGSFEMIRKTLQQAGVSEDKINDVMNVAKLKPGASSEELVAANEKRQQMVDELIQGQMGGAQETPQNYTIELGPLAGRILELIDPNGKPIDDAKVKHGNGGKPVDPMANQPGYGKRK